ncbi:MAG: hypothetical protein M0Z69_07935, partial [Actinomycetota bacterium]|nr:hypothetical protein [Actinomycetota bacterium]
SVPPADNAPNLFCDARHGLLKRLPARHWHLVEGAGAGRRDAGPCRTPRDEEVVHEPADPPALRVRAHRHMHGLRAQMAI